MKQFYTFREKQFTKCYDGTEIVGTEAAIKAEAKAVWAKILKGEEGGRMRANMGKLRDTCEKSWENGRSREVMEGFGKYF